MSLFDLNLDPSIHFDREFKKAESLAFKDFNAMSLATCSRELTPSVRTVLFKGMVRGGFSFYTNYNSQKSKELEQNAQASLLFFWPQLDQQIRIDGVVHTLTRAESEAYFKTRPRLSQIGAWSSAQSEIISGPSYLAEQVQKNELKFQGQEVPCPPHWGGWHVLPLKIEFWFGQQGRLHDRFVYSRSSLEQQKWTSLMKSP